jgi:hypothetical protein
LEYTILCIALAIFLGYDGGKAVMCPLDDVKQTMKEIADVIADLNPDIVLLQEVDMHSKRTCYTNELEGILRHLDDAGLTFPYVSTTPYHKCRYVPTPAHQHMGKVDFHLAGAFNQRVPLPTDPNCADALSVFISVLRSAVQISNRQSHETPTPPVERVTDPPSLQLKASCHGRPF